MIYSDTAGNYYLGDCLFANHDINYRTFDFLRAHPHASISSELTSLLISSGLSYRNVASQGLFDSPNSDFTLVSFAADSDAISTPSRFTFNKVNSAVGASTPSDGTSMYDDTGYTPTDNTLSSTNALSVVSNSFSYPFIATSSDVETHWSGVADAESLALYCYSISKADPTKYSRHFWYAGTLSNVNTTYGYYSANQLTKSVCLYFSEYNGTYSYYGGRHYIGGASKQLLQTRGANYTITCTDAQTPVNPWSTFFYVYDDDTEIGDPLIGRVDNLLLGTGSYVIGRPVVLNTPVGDTGSNVFLPVGTFAGKTVLMRCYSSGDYE
jgi:hypothetical protein